MFFLLLFLLDAIGTATIYKNLLTLLEAKYYAVKFKNNLYEWQNTMSSWIEMNIESNSVANWFCPNFETN